MAVICACWVSVYHLLHCVLPDSSMELAHGVTWQLWSSWRTVTALYPSRRSRSHPLNSLFAFWSVPPAPVLGEPGVGWRNCWRVALKFGLIASRASKHILRDCCHRSLKKIFKLFKWTCSLGAVLNVTPWSLCPSLDRSSKTFSLVEEKLPCLPLNM